jgi:hypothetical protein
MSISNLTKVIYFDTLISSCDSSSRSALVTSFVRPSIVWFLKLRSEMRLVKVVSGWMRLGESVRGWMSLLEVRWFTERLSESERVGWVLDRLDEILRRWLILWEVGWVFERLGESVRSWVHLWEVGWVCERLGKSERGWVSLWEVGWVC